MNNEISGSEKDYKFGNKNNWRRWAWNRIEERIDRPRRDCKILYLAGENNLDMKEASRRGFKSQNMIAIERDKKLCRDLRKKGITTIHGDMIETIKKWGNEKIDIVISDYCCGLNNNVLEQIVIAFWQPCFRDCVFSINLMRGREVVDNNFMTYFHANKRHRGLSFAGIVAACVLESTRGEDGERWFFIDAEKITEDAINRRAEFSYNEYKSGNLCFDSVVYKNPSREWARVVDAAIKRAEGLFAQKQTLAPDFTDRQWESLVIKESEKWFERIYGSWSPELLFKCEDKSIIAAKAVRTMRA